MVSQLLTAFWVVPPNRHGPLGYGVTAFSLADALHIIRKSGYSLPEDLAVLSVTEGVQPTDLHWYVQANMGPIVVRELWYPFLRVGL